MPMPVRPPGEPVADEFRFVARCIVHHDMHVEAVRDIAFDLIEELAELLRPVTRHAGSDHGACLHLRLGRDGGDEAGEERGRAMAVVVMGAPLDLSGTHRQQWLCSIKSLDLALFVDADNQRLFWRIEIEADDVPHLLDELRIGREFKRLRGVWLQRESAPDSMHSRCGHARRARQAARTPVRGVLRLRLERPCNDVFNPVVANLARSAASRLVVEAVQAMLCKPLAPCTYGLAARTNSLGDLAVLQFVRRTQDNLGPLGFTACDLARRTRRSRTSRSSSLSLIAIAFLALPIAIIPPNHR